MANEKFLYVNGQGNYNEAAAAVQTSTGASDAGKLIQTDASGKIDSSLLNFSLFNKVYAARVASTADITLSAPGSAIDGVTLSNGDRFLAKNQTTGSQNGIYVFNGAASAATRATDWDENAEVKAGDIVVIEEGTANDNKMYILTTNNPITVGTTTLTFADVGTQLIGAGDGLSFVGSTLNVNAGDGIQILSDNVTAKVSDFAGLGLEDDGSNNLAIDFANPATELNTDRALKASDLSSTGANQGAKILGFDATNVAAYTSATKLQGAVEDAFNLAAAPGVKYTVGTGGVTAGHPVYISADDTIRAFGALSSTDRVIGVSYTTASAAATARVIKDSAVVTGALSGATAGQRIYWDGSALTSTLPSGSGAHVWVIGYAKNATDLHVSVEFLKKNA